jgi:hypothetical protein
MNTTDQKSSPGKTLRKRIEKEDSLLNSRTSVFLITGSLLLTAFGVSDDTVIRFIISILGILVTLAWGICSMQNWKVIKNLTTIYVKTNTEDITEKIVQAALFHPGWRRPTDLIARVLPLIFLCAWVALLVLHLLKLFRLLILF